MRNPNGARLVFFLSSPPLQPPLIVLPVSLNLTLLCSPFACVMRGFRTCREAKMREFSVGERILATWADGKKYPAKVSAVLTNGKRSNLTPRTKEARLHSRRFDV